MCDRSSELGGRIGRLTAALDTLLEVIDEQPTVLDPFHAIVIEHARRALDEAGFPVAVRR